jgi:hypothetical protein
MIGKKLGVCLIMLLTLATSLDAWWGRGYRRWGYYYPYRRWQYGWGYPYWPRRYRPRRVIRRVYISEANSLTKKKNIIT